jgi:hypothetical protein
MKALLSISRFGALLALGALFLQGCGNPLAVPDEVVKEVLDRRAAESPTVETVLDISDDGHVQAAGPVEEVAESSLRVVGMTFQVTERTELRNATGAAMKLRDMAVGMYVQINGVQLDDGSVEASSAQVGETATVCHMPPGNPDNAHTLVVGAGALEGHLGHGDYEGECEAPADPDEEEEESDEGEGEKVAICHIPPGNPDNARTIEVDPESVEDHLAHGDYEGECEDAPSDPDEGEDENDENDEGEGEKVAICHIPPGNPDNARTIVVDPESVEDHLGHGDYEGECEVPDDPGDDPGEGDEQEEENDEGEGEKVTICHVPPGNPDNARTIEVDPESVEDHLAHGDYEGECQDPG